MKENFFVSFLDIVSNALSSAWGWFGSIFGTYGVSDMLALVGITILTVKVISPLIRTNMEMTGPLTKSVIHKSRKDNARKGDD